MAFAVFVGAVFATALATILVFLVLFVVLIVFHILHSYKLIVDALRVLLFYAFKGKV